MFGAINQNIQTIVTIISIGLLIAIYFAFQFRINLWWTSFWYSLPVIGKLARLSKDTTRNGKNTAWTNSERALCDDYKKYVTYPTQIEFKRRINYLRKAEDLGRTPLPAWMLFLLAPLVIAEGLGFSYLLGTWMAMEGSESTHQVLMVAIVFVLAVVLLFVTHVAGHQLYRSNLISRCNKEWRDDGQPGKYQSAKIALEDDQSEDDDQAPYTQCVNRVGTTRSYAMVIIAIISIAFIAGLSTWMRIKHLETVTAQETTGVAATSAGNPFSSMPPELSAPQAQADNQAKADIEKSNGQEGMAAFIMLAFIFVVTQIVGISAGYKWGFAGNESKKAYKGIHGFSTYDDLVSFYEPIIQIAQAKLQTLQQRLSERGSNINLNLHKTFNDYLKERQLERKEQSDKDGQSDSEALPSTASNASQTKDHLTKIESMGEDKEAKKRYINDLSPEDRETVKAGLKLRKEQEESARQGRLNKELDEIL